MLKWSDFRRIISLTSDPTQTCNVTCYGPIRYEDRIGRRVILTQGGIITPPGGWKMDDYSVRHADQLYLSIDSGLSLIQNQSWTPPREVVTRKNVRWMNDPAYMGRHPEAFVSAWTVGNVIQIPGHPDNEFIGIFCGCVNDPNCGTEWGFDATPYGSRLSPFPYFQAFVMRSPNGIDGWEVVENLFGKKSGDVIEDSRFLGLTPAPADYNLPPDGPTGFKGVDKCSIGVQLADGLWYGTADFWSSWGPKTLVWRALLTELKENGPEIHVDGVWYPTADGAIPAWINNDTSKAQADRIWVGNAFDCPAGTITIAPPNSPHKYMIALLKSLDGEPPHRRVQVSYTDDCVSWTSAVPVTEMMPVEIGDPQVYAEVDGSVTVLMDATECPNTAYNGRGVYEGNVRL